MDFLGSIWDKFTDGLLAVLPRSPFSEFIGYFENLPYLGWLNWIVPIKEILLVFSAYLAAVAVYYLWSIVLRWIQAID